MEAHSSSLFATRFGGSSIDYQGSSYKEKAKQMSAYAYFGAGLSHSFEMGITQLHRQQKNTDDLDQMDITAITTFYPSAEWSWRGGLHWIESTHDATNEGRVGIVGFNYHSDPRWNLGLDVFYSAYPHYRNHSALTYLLGEEANDDLNSIQLSPQFGFYLVPHWYLQSQLDWIQTSNNPELESTASHRFQQSVSWIQLNWSANLYAWRGDNVFNMRDQGFTVINSSEIQKEGRGFGGTWIPTPVLSVTASVGQESSEEILNPKTVKSQSVTLQLGYTF